MPDEAISIGKIHHLVINVSDLDASLDFYRDVLGLKDDGSTEVGGPDISRLIRVPPGSTARNAFLSTGSGMGRIELLQWSIPGEEAGPQPRARNGAQPGFAIAAFLLREPQLRAMYDRLAADYVCWSEPQEFIVKGQRLHSFIVEDPDGNLLELFSLPD